MGGIHAVTVRDAQIAVLQHRLSEMDKCMVRLKEVTKERISAFREACYSLFGYRYGGVWREVKEEVFIPDGAV